MKRILTVLIATTLAACAWAASPQENCPPSTPKIDAWKGTKVTGGAIINTGNTRSTNMNAEGDLNYKWTQRWVTLNKITYQQSQTAKDGTTAQSVFMQTQWQYNFTANQKNYFYVLANYLDDRFDGYEYVFNENIGYGRNLSLNDKMTLSLFIGPGLRQDRLNELPDTFQNEPSLQIGANYTWVINSTTSLTEQYQTTTTKDNTNTTSTTAINTNLFGNLGFSVSYTFSYDSKPAPSKYGFNSTTALNLVYNF